METVIENELKDKINNLGSGMIMDAIDKLEQNDGKENLEKLIEATQEAENNQDDKEINDIATGAKHDMTSMIYGRPRYIHPIIKDHKTRRNDPCPCGSNLKYKNCCLSSGRYETYSRV